MILSVVIPFHENNLLLHRAIASVVNQLDSNTELLLIGDGIESFIVEEIQLLYPQIKVYAIPKSGANSARSAGMKLSSGIYILMMDSDDFLPPQALLTYLEAIEKNGVDIIIGNVMRFNDNKQHSLFYRFKKEGIIHKKDLSVDQLYHFPVLICKCFKKALLNDFQLPDTFMFQDVVLTAFLFQKSNLFQYINTPLYHYYQRPHSVSHYSTSTVKKIKGTLDVIESVKSYYARHILSSTEQLYLDLLTVRFYFTLIRRSFILNDFTLGNILRQQFKKEDIARKKIRLLNSPKAFIITVLLSNVVLFKLYFYLRLAKNQWER